MHQILASLLAAALSQMGFVVRRWIRKEGITEVISTGGSVAWPTGRKAVQWRKWQAHVERAHTFDISIGYLFHSLTTWYPMC